MFRDIPFGYLDAREGRPYFATNWLYGNGLVYINKGTKKQWVDNGLMVNVLAWGGFGINNRIHYDFWANRPFDQRLNGKHTIEYFLIPTDEFNPQYIIHEVDNLTSDVFTTHGQGEKSFYEINDKDIIVTSFYVKNNSTWVRGYQIPSLQKQPFKDFEIFNMEYESLHKLLNQ